MPPNAALPPASENGVDATAVPKTLAFFGAPKAAKSVTTLRGGDDDDAGGLLGTIVEYIFSDVDRAGGCGEYGYEYKFRLAVCLARRYFSVKREPWTLWK